RVHYKLRASHITPAVLADTLCTRTPLTFTNTSSRRYTNRFYNLNEFYKKWNLYSPFVVQPVTGGGFSADSSITWYVEYNDGLTPPRDPRIFLPYINNGTVTAFSDRPGCFTSNAFRACLRPMTAYGRGKQLNYSEEFTICMKYCNDALGLTKFQKLVDLNIYPNPGVQCSITVQSTNVISKLQMYDAAAKLVLEQCVNQKTVQIDPKVFVSGIYTVMVYDEWGRLNCRKLVINH
ncbi:MAG: T9SS type A sorting domain-containing protein, partial [bacterium]|nr:T9SS type A sorting domain-containing protein [bacterium]